MVLDCFMQMPPEKKERPCLATQQIHSITEERESQQKDDGKKGILLIARKKMDFSVEDSVLKKATISSMIKLQKRSESNDHVSSQTEEREVKSLMLDNKSE